MIFEEVFPVARLPVEVPKSTLYMLLLLYIDEGNASAEEVEVEDPFVDGPAPGTYINKFRNAVNEVIARIRSGKLRSLRLNSVFDSDALMQVKQTQVNTITETMPSLRAL